MKFIHKCLALGLVTGLALGAGCSDRKKGAGAKQGEDGEAAEGHTGVLKIDGSSTVFPITQAVAEEYRAKHGGDITIGVSGTGGGFKKFCRGETSLTGASRPIKESEREMCKSAGIEYIELPVAYDGLAVLVNPKNDWVDYLTVEELKRMFEPEATGKIMKWSQVREGWPDEDLHLFAPGVDSGTYDYFTAAIVGKEHASRSDLNTNEDDNALVQGIATDRHALGFFGFAYYDENRNRLKVVPIDDAPPRPGDGPIEPTLETVKNGTYQPLSRPIFIYVNAARKDAVGSFVDFWITEGAALAKEVGYIPLPPEASKLVQKRFDDVTTGSLFEGGSQVGVTVEELLKSDS
jgi:phosphate transport system substrate-binding protein